MYAFFHKMHSYFVVVQMQLVFREHTFSWNSICMKFQNKCKEITNMWNLIYSNCFINHNGNLTNVPDFRPGLNAINKRLFPGTIQRKRQSSIWMVVVLARTTKLFWAHPKTMLSEYYKLVDGKYINFLGKLFISGYVCVPRDIPVWANI